jgi:1-aminocyclopropane-1-carboxylate deaminase
MIQQASRELVEEFFPGLKSLSFLRLDLPDPVAGGNKSFKLKYHLEVFRMMGEGSVLSFGGAYSNHIAALACAGKANNIPTIGVIRGEELSADSNPVLKFASECGMKLHFISRGYYRQKNDTESTLDFVDQFGTVYIVPEGGGGDQGVRGCLEILTPECDAYDEIFLPVGTGTTMAGIVQTAKAHQRVNGIAVVADQSLAEKITRMMYENISCEWNLLHDFTLGGYANTSDDLNEFIREMKSRFDLPLDHVYSGKALFALHRMSDSGSFKEKNALFVHTGGYAFSTQST